MDDKMKILKRLSIFVILLGGLFLFTGCTGGNVEGSLEDIMTKVYADVEEKPMGLMNMEVNEETIEGFLGTKEIDYTEALASESMVGSIAHSVILVRTDGDVEAVKNKIKENVNPRKWICVGVEPEDVIIKNKGNLIIVIIVEDEPTRTLIEKGFDAL